MIQQRSASLRRTALALASTLWLLVLGTTALFAQTLDFEKLSGLETRAIGPAGMSGRVTAVAGVHSDPNILYAGTASGGLWKSTGGGVTWEPIFDEQSVASIGALAVYQRNPSIVYVGTGEGNPRNSQTYGNGVYKSLDAGKTWMHLGLDATSIIHRILVHPDNPEIVYVGAQGPAWGDSDARGVYKTTDGGATWQKILYINERTGVGEMVMDPTNPDKLIVGMWEFRRWPWIFKSGGEGSSMHITFDGGKTWTKRTEKEGLPKGELGRMGLAIAPSNPNVVYALIESEKNALYRSDDGGFTFRFVADENIGDRPFYYAEIHVDTKNENRLYNLYSSLDVSDDGGRTFRSIGSYSTLHPDHHAWWQHPEDPNLILNGNDGGLYISRDRGTTWRFAENLPLAQFYHINVDMAKPYNVMGGLQDNGSWHGPSTVYRSGGLRNSYWQEVGFGDGFDVVPDASDARYIYGMSQGGNLYRTDLVTGNTQTIRPTAPDGVELRFNWNAGLAHDPFSPTTLYYGSQFLHKTTDRGRTWEIISPDLTTNDPEKQKQLESGGLSYDVTAAENHTTIVAVAPSPVQAGVIWVGTDDGNVQVTTDGGANWSNVVGNIRGVPASTWVPQIHTSAHQAGEAFVVFEDHRRHNWEPYVYRTKDFGKTFTRLVDKDDVWGYALAFVQDSVEPRLMFVGTEFGLYVSVDDGATWNKWKNGFPTVSTMDMVIHPRDHDLVIGTFGRSVYILDDIRPLRALAQEGIALLDEPVVAFEAPAAYLVDSGQAFGTRFAADAYFFGQTRPTGAMITFSINPEAAKAAQPEGEEVTERPAGAPSMARGAGRPGQARGRRGPGGGGGEEEVTIEIVDAGGAVIRTFKRNAKPGINRTTWELRRKGVRIPGMSGYGGGGRQQMDAGEPAGAYVLPGTYTARITYKGSKDSTRVTVEPDPRVSYDVAGATARSALYDRWTGLVEPLATAIERLTEAGAAVETVTKQIGARKDDEAKAVLAMAGELKKKFDGFTERMRGKQVQGIYRDPNTLQMVMYAPMSYITSGTELPGQAEERTLARAEAAAAEMLNDVNAFFAEDWAKYRAAVEAAKVEFVKEYEPIGG